MYVCTYSRAHTRKFAHANDISTCGKRYPYFASSVATPSLEAVKSQTLSQKYERARYRNKFELGAEPGKLILDQGDRL